MSDTDDLVKAPVEFVVVADGKVTLKFGPMPMDDLMEVLANLATEEGSHSFLSHLVDAMRKEVERERE